MEPDEEFKILVIDDVGYKTRFTKKFENRKAYVKPDPRKIVSFIPGTVVEIFVEEGQAVERGDDLVLLEAMKMNNRITSPVSGIIRRLNVSVGETVAKGRLIVEIA